MNTTNESMTKDALDRPKLAADDLAFINDQIAWLQQHKEEMGASWAELGRWTGVPKGTISNFAGPSGYTGDNMPIAASVAQYRATLVNQAQVTAELPDRPGYFETPTSKAVTQYLHQAQRGRIVLVALGAGLGKTESAKNFKSGNANVFHCTMAPSSSGLMPMQLKVLRALGERDATGAPLKLSQMICDKVRDRTAPLIIIDEAQHLSIKALEEIRSWHDETGVGIALLGNEMVQQQLDGVSRAATFAQMFSRVALRMVRSKAIAGDAEALAAAWHIADEEIITFLKKIVQMPGALRGATFALEVAHILAAKSGVMTLRHIENAWAQNSASARAA